MQVEQSTWTVFRNDTDEGLGEIEDCLLSLEEQPGSAEVLNRLYRALHTLKGNAGLLRLTSLEKLAHATEDLVALVREGVAAFDGELAELLLQMKDHLAILAQRVTEAQRDVHYAPMSELIARAQAWIEARTGLVQAPESEEDSKSEVVAFEFWSNAPGGSESATSVDVSVPALPLPSVPEEPGSAAGGGVSGLVEGQRAASSAAQFLKIEAHKVSSMMDLAGELTLAAGAITRNPALVNLELEGFDSAVHKLDMLMRELQNEVSGLRLVQISGMFRSMRRVARDAATRTGKNVRLELRGEETELDKLIVDGLHGPLVHVVRNAIDHGIELPEERKAAGKPELGSVVLDASHRGSEVCVTVRDDGRGLNLEAIERRAKERGLVDPQASLSPAEVANLVFLPGLSTAKQVSELSGRGVGMDAVRSAVEALRGSVRVETQRGLGSVLTITLPLTLAFVEAMVVTERGRLFALPMERVCEVFRVRHDQVKTSTADKSTLLRVRDTLVPVLTFSHFYGEAEVHDDVRLAEGVVVVVQTAGGTVALPVDRVLGTEHIMLKPLHPALSKVRAAVGCGMLRSGEVALALDCERLSM